MANRSTQKRAPAKTYEQRKLRRNQVIFGFLSVILILSWIASLIMH